MLDRRTAYWQQWIGTLEASALETARRTARVYDEDPFKWDPLVGTCEGTLSPTRPETGEVEFHKVGGQCTGRLDVLTLRIERAQ